MFWEECKSSEPFVDVALLNTSLQRTIFVFRCALALITACGCAKRYPIAGAPPDAVSADPGSVFQEDVPLRIESRFYADVVISIERGGLRTRLATIPGSSTRDLMIPKRFFEIMTPIRLIAEGIAAATGGERASTTSGNLIVRPGQRIVWSLESQLQRSSVGVY
jgi:hypothetical protein